MRVFEKILCPIDFSESSTKALQWTQHLAEKFDSQVVILHVTEFYPANGLLDVDYESYQRAVKTHIMEFLAPLRIKYQTMLSSGEPAQKIAALASGLETSVIIMGTEGRRGAAHRLLGSTTEALVRKANIPVFTVSPDCSAPQMNETKQVLLPVSRLDQPPGGYIRLRKILRDMELSPTLMHTVELNDPMFDSNFHASPFLMTTVETTEKQQLLERIGSKLLKSLEHQGEPIVKFGNVAQEILKELHTGKYDFVLLGARKRRLLSRFVESIAYEVISKSPVPVITVRVR